MSTWYKRYEMGKRYAGFYLIGCVASAFGGILAFGLMQMEGIAGYGGWRWIFIIEGIVSSLASPMSWDKALTYHSSQSSSLVSALSSSSPSQTKPDRDRFDS